jgi:predicted nucleic acid-binding protein
MLHRVRHEGARQPAIWVLEIASALFIGERRGRLTTAEFATFVQTLQDLPIDVDDFSPSPVWSSTLDLARRANLSAYNATSIDLAVRDGLPLVTMDKRMVEAASRIGVDLIEPPNDSTYPADS